MIHARTANGWVVCPMTSCKVKEFTRAGSRYYRVEIHNRLAGQTTYGSAHLTEQEAKNLAADLIAEYDRAGYWQALGK